MFIVKIYKHFKKFNAVTLKFMVCSMIYSELNVSWLKDVYIFLLGKKCPGHVSPKKKNLMKK